MVYQHTSIDPLIGRIIRNTGIQDTAYIIHMDEWIPEAMQAMKTNMQYSPAYFDVNITFHKGKLPCGIVYIDAVEYKGKRLPYGNSVKNLQTGPQQSESTGAYIPVLEKRLAPDGNYLYTTSLQQATELPSCSNAFYQLEMGCILTSFETGCVRVHGRVTPTDEKGLPLIPDNHDYKEAIYWYVRAKMIESGYNDTVFGWEVCDRKWEKHANRAIQDIDYPSPDMMQHMVNTLVRMVPPDHYYDSFFNIDRPGL
jgi:hypothetical protein